jgi:hypothetical protein
VRREDSINRGGCNKREVSEGEGRGKGVSERRVQKGEGRGKGVSEGRVQEGEGRGRVSEGVSSISQHTPLSSVRTTTMTVNLSMSAH